MADCNPLLPHTCIGDAIGGAVSSAASAAGESLAEQFREGAEWVIETTVGWWLTPNAIDIESAGVGLIRSYVLYIAVAVAVGGVLWQAIRMMVLRKADPLVDIGRGLTMMALWGAIGVTAPQLLLQGGDAFAEWVVGESVNGQVVERLTTITAMSGFAPGAVMVVSLLLMLSGLIQAVLMLFREGAVVILSGMTVLAAAGQFTEFGRSWLPKVLGWMLALVAYKPIAALVYASAFTLIGEGDDPRTVFVGLTMILISIVALPALMKLFSWTVGGAMSGGGGGALAGMAGGAASMAMARGGSQMIASGPDSATHAREMRANLGPAVGPTDTGGGSGPAGAGISTSKPATPTGAESAAGATPAAAVGSQAAGAGASSAAAGGSAGAAAAAGPAGAAVAGGMAAKDAVKEAGNAAAGAMTDDGGGQ